ncbi:deoxyribodipyrimidine photo-lyase [soil metagenome]
MPGASVLWLRRDLRLGDNPALSQAAASGGVLALFVLDPRLLHASGRPRLAHLIGALRALDADLREHGRGLVVRAGDPVEVVPAVAAEVAADSVHIAADFAPYGAARDRRVEAALAERPGVPLVRTGSPYAVAPGRVLSKSGDGFKVFTPFYRAWLEHGWREPADSDPAAVDWVGAPSDPLPRVPSGLEDLDLPAAGERAALERWHAFDASTYGEERDRPDLDSTSRMSVHLKWGTIHPRTLLADLKPAGSDPQHDKYRSELAWREFYAAVLHHWPDSARDYFQPQLAAMPYADGAALDHLLDAWATGRTGFPIIDAGMRQLLGEGWMHNRVRMLVASFLVKDLHVEWTHGARHFMRHLVDGDLASNQHGWQWVAGCGTDAAPYFRIFNPITQGLKFDPNGDYVRRWVPELADLPGATAHEPWKHGTPRGYPARIVDHAVERQASLDAYQEVKR